MVLLLAFSLQDQVEKDGAYVGIAAFFGLAVLSLLYFAQAREVKRLREWAGRAPERAHEVEERAIAQAEAARAAPAPRRAAAQAAAGRRGHRGRRPLRHRGPGRAGRRRRDRRGRAPEAEEAAEERAAVEGPVTEDGKQPASGGRGERRRGEEDERARRAGGRRADDEDAARRGRGRRRRRRRRGREPDGARPPAAATRGAARGRVAQPRRRPRPSTAAGVAERAPDAPRPAARPAAARSDGRRRPSRAPGAPPPRRSPPRPPRAAAPDHAVRLAAPPGHVPPRRPGAAAPAPAGGGHGRRSLRDRRRCRRGRRRPRRARGHAAARRRRGAARAEPGRHADRRPPTDEASRTAAAAAAASVAHDRADTTVAVLNGTTVNGLAASTADKLQSSGYKRGTTGDFTDQQRATSVVLYGAQRARQAREIGARARHLRAARDGRRDAGARRRERGRRGRRRRRPGALDHRAVSTARPRRLRAAGGGDVRGVLRRPAPEGRRVGGGVSRSSSASSRPTATAAATSTGSRSRSRRPTSVDRRRSSTRDGDRVRRLASGSRRARTRPVRSCWDGRTDAGRARARRPLPDAGDPAPQGRSVRCAGRSTSTRRRRRRSCCPSTPPIAGPRARRVRDPRPRRRRAAARRASACCAPTSSRPRRSRASAAARAAAAASGTGGSTACPRRRAPTWSPSRCATAPATSGTGPRLPPGRARSAAGPASRSAQIAAQPPVEPVRAGERVEFFVDSRRRSYRWSVRRVGAARPVKQRQRGAPGRDAALRAPRGISGVYLLEVRSGGTAPACRSSCRRRSARGCSSWSRRSPGSASTRSTTTATGSRHARDRRAGAVAARVRRQPGLPAAFADQTAPLLVFLDRARIRYDLTTDLALARSRDPRATDREGVAAGRLAALGPALARAPAARATSRTAAGCASFGTDSAAPRRARRRRTALTRPTQPTPTDPFGARLEPVAARAPATTAQPLPLTALADDPTLGLLTGSDGVLPGFGRLEESASRPEPRGGKVRRRARPGRHRRRARRRGGRRRAPARGAARADRDATRQGRRDPRRAHRVVAGGHGPRGRADHAQHRRRAAAASSRGCARRAADDPELRHPQRRGGRSSSVREDQRRPLAAASSSSAPLAVLGAPVPQLRAGVAGEQRAGEEELERVEDRHGGRRAGQPIRRAWPIARRPRRAAPCARGQPRRIDRHDPRRAQQLAHGLREIEALERPGQQQDEKRLVHRWLTL